MEYTVSGTVMQALDVILGKGESVYTEAGGMAWMGGPVEMTTNTKGGLMKGLGRALAGESLFMTTYTCRGNRCLVVFTPEAPGKIIPLELAAGQSVIAQRDAFMCAQEGVKLEMHFHKRLGAGLFGGEGFFLEKITGPGLAFLEIGGEVREYTLQAGQTLKIDPGHIAAFEPTVNYSIERVKGLKNIFFSGEGLFLATLTGPGKVWLQTMPVVNLAMKIAHYIPAKGG